MLSRHLQTALRRQMRDTNHGLNRFTPLYPATGTCDIAALAKRCADNVHHRIQVALLDERERLVQFDQTSQALTNKYEFLNSRPGKEHLVDNTERCIQSLASANMCAREQHANGLQDLQEEAHLLEVFAMAACSPEV